MGGIKFAIPIAVIGTFAVMYFCNFSINNISLLALTLAVGFVVDDAIVMLENIVRHIEDGVGYQQARTQSYVENLFAATLRSRLTDNGRQAFTLNADTDIAENATFSLQGSRIVNFDRNLNRRLTQTVITAVLQMQFFAGDLR